MPVPGAQIRMADTSSDDPNQHLIIIRIAEFQLLNAEISRLFKNDCGFNFHFFPPDFGKKKSHAEPLSPQSFSKKYPKKWGFFWKFLCALCGFARKITIFDNIYLFLNRFLTFSQFYKTQIQADSCLNLRPVSHHA
jgi:hypothetical protein